MGRAGSAGGPAAFPRRVPRRVVCLASGRFPSEGGGRLVVLGLGFVGTQVAREVCRSGGGQWDVCGTVESEAARGRAVRAGAGAVREAWVVRVGADGAAEGEVGALREALLGATHVLCTIAPAGRGDPVLIGEVGAAVEKAWKAGGLAWAGYVSSTGVYGDHGGRWVDEGDELLGGERLQARVAAEAAWRARVGARVFRMGGVYGPGRSALDAARRETLGPGGHGNVSRGGGPDSERERRRFTARIHVDDAARAVVASMTAGDAPGRVYNVVDDDPASRSDVLAHARGLLGLPAAPHGSQGQGSPGAAPQGEKRVDEKRVRNARIKRELGVRLAYPSYVQGLRACLDAAENEGGGAHQVDGSR